MSVVVVVGWLRALVSTVLLWRSTLRQRAGEEVVRGPAVYLRRTVVLLWRRVALLRATIAALGRWCTVATTTIVILLSGIIRHVELRSGEWRVERWTTGSPFGEASRERFK